MRKTDIAPALIVLWVIISLVSIIWLGNCFNGLDSRVQKIEKSYEMPSWREKADEARRTAIDKANNATEQELNMILEEADTLEGIFKEEKNE